LSNEFFVFLEEIDLVCLAASDFFALTEIGYGFVNHAFYMFYPFVYDEEMCCGS
jgi:hypothetical protein